MGSVDRLEDRTFRVNLDGDGADKLRESVKNKLKEFMGDYTDDTLVVMHMYMHMYNFCLCIGALMPLHVVEFSELLNEISSLVSYVENFVLLCHC